VFVQYLFGLAVIEWIEKFFDGKVLVRLKWPNDIYGSTTGGKSLEAFKKMGGILVNCSFGGLNGTECKLIIGWSLCLHGRFGTFGKEGRLNDLIYQVVD
jgi:biotin-(acetyl-CoA carboxylase) ligase